MKIMRSLLLLAFLAPISIQAQNQQEWQLIYSSNINGELKPCGCSAEGNLGGLLRRATMLEKIRKNKLDTVSVSAGDILGDTTEQGKIKNKYLLKGFEQLGLNAVLPGERELASVALSESNLPWVLSNSTAFKKIPRFRKVDLANGSSVYILGIIEPGLAKGNRIGLKDPVLSVNKTLSKIKPAVTDTVLVLVHGSSSLVKKISENKRINILVRGHLDKPVKQALTNGMHGQAMLAAGHRGQRIGLATFSSNNIGKLKINKIISLPKSITDHESLSHLYSQYDADVIKWFRARSLAMKKKLKNTKQVFSSDRACQQCHQAIHKKWGTSRHADAYSSLVKAGKHEDPECLKCHTTGMGKSGGFISQSLTANLLNVQCESCHGAARKHAEYPIVHQPWKAMGVCKTCHTPENSPSFSLQKYWSKISHKTKTKPSIHKQSISRVKGIYDVLNKNHPVLTNKKVVLTEFFNFYCSRCYILNRSWPDMVEFLDKPINHKEVPIIFGTDQKPWAAIAWLAAKNAGKGTVYKDAVFKSKFEQHQDIGNKDLLIKLAEKFGIGKTVRQALASTNSKAGLSFRQGMKRKKRFSITATPTILINSNLRVLPSHTGNNTELLLENVREILLDMQCRQHHACDL